MVNKKELYKIIISLKNKNMKVKLKMEKLIAKDSTMSQVIKSMSLFMNMIK